MNKAEITIMRIKNCETYEEACEKINDPIKGFGYNLSSNDRSYCLAIARMHFYIQTISTE